MRRLKVQGRVRYPNWRNGRARKQNRWLRSVNKICKKIDFVVAVSENFFSAPTLWKALDALKGRNIMRNTREGNYG